MIIAIVILFFVITCLLFYNRRGAKPGAAEKLSDACKLILKKQVAYYQKLNKKDKDRFEAMILSFLAMCALKG
jgi:hypothetical protein